MSADQPSLNRQLVNASRPFAEEHVQTSWFHLLTSYALLLALLALAALPSLPFLARLAASVTAGLTAVRVFILYHDHMHGSLLRKSRVANALLSFFGLWVLAPPGVWKQTHNYHHAHTAQIIGSHVGSYPMMTVDMWMRATPTQRLLYRIVRHPLNMLFGYFTIFAYGMCVSSFLRSPKRCFDSLLALVLQAVFIAAFIRYGSVETMLLAHLLPLMVATSLGSYLFYAQHNFEGMHLAPRQEWTFTKAALESSSYMKTGPIMGFFTGDIGFHHVHHLNPSIPFYRLQEAMRAIPELQQPAVTSLSLKDIRACLQLKLWDPTAGRMVGFPPANVQNATAS